MSSVHSSSKSVVVVEVIKTDHSVIILVDNINCYFSVLNSRGDTVLMPENKQLPFINFIIMIDVDLVHKIVGLILSYITSYRGPLLHSIFFQILSIFEDFEGAKLCKFAKYKAEMHSL